MEKCKLGSISQPTVADWAVNDVFGNPVSEGEHIYNLSSGEIVHREAAEDYLIEKLDAKIRNIIGWSGGPQTVFMFRDGTWINGAEVHLYFTGMLGAHAFERKSTPEKQK